jgi:hypothetical protein
MKRFAWVLLGVFMLDWAACDNDPPVAPQVEKPSVTVQATLPSTLNLATLKLDISGSPLLIEGLKDFIWTRTLPDGTLIFGFELGGTITAASKNFRITDFWIDVEPLNRAVPLSPNNELGTYGVFYPSVLAAGQKATFSWWHEYYTDQRLFEGFTYKIRLTAKEISPQDVKEEGIRIL